MLAKKLHYLLKELNVSQVKSISYRCSLSKDKRYDILRKIILERHLPENEINAIIEKMVSKFWPKSPDKEFQLKIRRLNSFLTKELELTYINDFASSNDIYKDFVLSKVFEKSNNSNLIEDYSSSLYNKSKKNENPLLLLQSLENKILLYSHSQSDQELIKSLELNEELVATLTKINREKKAKLFYSTSSIFIEKTLLIRDKKDEIVLDLLRNLSTEKDLCNKAYLYGALAKFHFEEKQFEHYLEEAKKCLSQVEFKDERFLFIQDSLLFFELRTLFFSGSSIEKLNQFMDEAFSKIEEDSQVWINFFFYKNLLQIFTKEELIDDETIKIIKKTFAKDKVVYFDFLMATLYIKRGELKRSMPFLNRLIYVDNYIFAIFSRLLAIKIQLLNGNQFLSKSYISSTDKMIKQNQANPLGRENNIQVLTSLKNHLTKRPKEVKFDIPLTFLHRFIVELDKK